MQPIIEKLHAIWLDPQYEDIREIEVEFNAVLKANNLPILPEEFYEDINCKKSDDLAYFAKKYEKWTAECDMCQPGEIDTDFWTDVDITMERYSDK